MDHFSGDTGSNCYKTITISVNQTNLNTILTSYLINFYSVTVIQIPYKKLVCSHVQVYVPELMQ